MDSRLTDKHTQKNRTEMVKLSYYNVIISGHAYTHTFSLSLSLSLSHTHTHTHTQTEK